LPFWMATLKLAAINDAQLFRALALTFQNSQRAGTFTLSAGTQDELLRYADWLRSLPASETAANLRAAGTMARAMSPYVDAQKIIGLVATDIPCLKNQTGLAMSSPLLFVYRQILAHQKDPETFFQILGQGLLPWLTTCQADPAFNPTSLAHLMRITNDNFTDISTFINLTLKSDDPLRAARLVGAQAQNLTADGQSPLSLLGSTGALDTLTRIMEATPLATEWLAQLPSLPTLQNLAQHASLDGFAGIAALSPDTIKQLNAATHELNLTPELFLEWQQLIGAFGDGSLPDLADYVQRGQLRSLSATLRKWTGEQS
ncbi:MAG: hypothetical protein JST16_10545, partial [Bdellovibrionales bacterium]|nr:hypothetical protein [Bdellovibrionales bacterium]